VAMEAGWLLTEWGRQPWVVRGHLRTAEALTPFRPLGPPFVTFTAVYLLLGGIVGYLLYRQVRGPTAGLVDEARAPAKGHDAGA
jgi:cytochrome d ubiquinol oxidase subunit I